MREWIFREEHTMRYSSKLTYQENKILALVAQGQRNAQIASTLVISVRTVENHVSHIFEKLGVSSRTEAAILALNNGLLYNAKMSSSSDDNGENHRYSQDKSRTVLSQHHV
jgi:DNA-binding NarL/FixJ family response regulator